MLMETLLEWENGFQSCDKTFSQWKFNKLPKYPIMKYLAFLVEIFESVRSIEIVEFI